MGKNANFHDRYCTETSEWKKGPRLSSEPLSVLDKKVLFQGNQTFLVCNQFLICNQFLFVYVYHVKSYSVQQLHTQPIFKNYKLFHSSFYHYFTMRFGVVILFKVMVS